MDPDSGACRWIRFRQVLLTLASVTTASCALMQPPPPAPPDLLQCYRLSGEVLDFMSDSIGYRVPLVIKLTSELNGAGKTESWTVLPRGHPKPYWTLLDWLLSSTPSSWETTRDLDPVPGDSFDIYFPCDIPCHLGDGVIRLGSDGTEYGGRAEWHHPSWVRGLWERMEVRAAPTSCKELPAGLEGIKRSESGF